jgi:succinyl-diaminopimelate desuccinylase
LGDNAVLGAIDVFRSIESLPFARHSSEHFDRPSVNLGRIWGGDALNKVPDRCVIDVDIRYLPGQDPEAITEEVRGASGAAVSTLLALPPATVDVHSPFVRLLREAAASHHEGEPMSVGRDGASDAVSFLRVGVPAVEFGPVGAGHHGPEEWVSVSSLQAYRQALESFLRAIPERLGDD